jgi:hypothetical protein
MAEKEKNDSTPNVNSTLEFYRRLTNLFSSGVNLHRKLKGYDYSALMSPKELALQGNIGYPSYNAYRHSYSGFIGMGYFGVYDRIYRYREYIEMDAQSSECSTALDTLADEVCAADQNDIMLHIETESVEIRKSLEELFYDVCRINSDLRYWVRSMLKFGDFFLFLDIREREGIINVDQIPAPDCERQEKYDPNDPHAVRFKITSPNVSNTPGAQTSAYLQNWQVANFRYLSNDAFRPSGTSWLEGARRPYRVLMMLIDAMLTYRIVRSPARRIFYIDTTGINPNDVAAYMEKVEEGFKGKALMATSDGKQDIRWNPSSMLEDYFIPIKRDSLTKVDTLEAAQHATAVDDIAFVHKQLTAALKMPRAFLGYDESVGKNNLSAQDIRFSKTVSVIQRIVLEELKRMAILHLYAKGFDGEDLINFNLKLTNPSTAAVLQKLELMEKKLDIAGKAKDLPYIDEEYIQKTVFGIDDGEIIRIRLGREQDAIRNKTIESLQPVKIDQVPQQDQFNPQNYDVPGLGNSNVATLEPQANPNSVSISNVPKINTSGYDSEIVKVEFDDKKAPIKANFFVPNKLTPELVKTANFNKQIVNPYFGMNMSSDQIKAGFTSNISGEVNFDKYYGNLLRESFKDVSGTIPQRGIVKEVICSMKQFKKHLLTEREKVEMDNLELLVEIDNSGAEEDLFDGILETVEKSTNS